MRYGSFTLHACCQKNYYSDKTCVARLFAEEDKIPILNLVQREAPGFRRTLIEFRTSALAIQDQAIRAFVELMVMTSDSAKGDPTLILPPLHSGGDSIHTSNWPVDESSSERLWYRPQSITLVIPRNFYFLAEECVSTAVFGSLGIPEHEPVRHRFKPIENPRGVIARG
jgi:hypothetical protein